MKPTLVVAQREGYGRLWLKCAEIKVLYDDIRIVFYVDTPFLAKILPSVQQLIKYRLQFAVLIICYWFPLVISYTRSCCDQKRHHTWKTIHL